MIVHALGYFNGFTGYNIHTRNFFSELAKLTALHKNDLTPGAENSQPPFDPTALAHPEELINIGILYGNKMGILQKYPGRKIGYTVWESTVLPDDWFGPLRTVDRIWIPSHWGKEVLVKNGFDTGKIDVVPEGFDPALFAPQMAKLPEITKLPGYKFLHVGRFEARKGSKELVQAFDQEFRGEPGVALVLACHNPFVKDFDIHRELAKLDLAEPGKIFCVAPVGPHDYFSRLYVSCDAFVFPTRAEGWGLPVIEAMASGLPTIVTNYSAQTEFVNAENAYLLDYTLTDVKLPFFLAQSGNYGQWAQPDIAQLRHSMRYIFEHQDEAKAKGAFAAEDMRKNWTWEAAAKKAFALLVKAG